MNLYDAHQFRFWPLSPDHMALEEGKAKNHKITTQKTAEFSLWKVMLQLICSKTQSKGRKLDSAVQHNKAALPSDDANHMIQTAVDSLPCKRFRHTAVLKSTFMFN